MAEINLETSQSQRQTGEKQPILEIERNKEEKQFRVKVGRVYYGWFADTTANRKAV